MIRRNAHIEIGCRNNQFVISMIANITQLIHHVHLDYLRRCPVYCTWWTCYTALCWQSLFDGVSHASAMFSCSRALRSLIIATSQRAKPAKPAKRKWWKGESSPKRVGLGPISLSAYHKFFKLLQTIPVTGVTRWHRPCPPLSGLPGRSQRRDSSATGRVQREAGSKCPMA